MSSQRVQGSVALDQGISTAGDSVVSAGVLMRRRDPDIGLGGPLVEREQELATLGQGLVAALGGAGSSIVIEGAAGTGKSRLLSVAGNMARAAEMQVLSANASELERDFSFGVAIQLFEPEWTSTGPKDRAALLRGPARAAVALLERGSPEAAPSPVDQGYPLIHGLLWLAINLGSAGPLAMLVDDVHWCDRPSLQFLAYLADRLADLPILLIVAVRPDEAVAEQQALVARMSAPAAVILRPGPLTEAGVESLVQSAFPGADQAFVTTCARVTAGNPLLLMQLLAQLRTDGRPPDRDTAQRLTDLAPQAIVDSVVARLGTMPPEARMLASAIVVLGDGASLRHASRLAGLSSDAAAQAADGLAAVQMLRPGEPLSFVHPLIRSAIAASMPALARADAHGRAASILREDDVAAEIIAAHLLLSPAGADPNAVATLRAAARTALARGSAESAVRLLVRALAETSQPEVRAEILAELGQAEALDGLPGAIDRLAEAIKLTDSPRRRAELVLAQAQALYTRASYQQAAEVLDHALADLKVEDAALAAELESAYVSAASLVPSLAGDAWARRGRILEHLSDPPTPAQRSAVAHIAITASVLGEPRASVRELADLAWGDEALLQDGTVEGRSWPLLSGALLFADELERDLEICDAALADARDRGSPLAFATVSYCRSWPLYEQGRIVEAAANAEAALDARPLDSSTDLRAACGVLACCHLQTGQLDRAETALATIDDEEVRKSARYPFLLDVRAQLRLAQHRPEEALEDATHASELLQSEFAADNPGIVSWRSTEALAQLALGERHLARELAEEGLERARSIGVTRVVIRNLRVLGLAEDGAAGIERLTEAVRIGQRYPARLEYTHALVELGAALRRANERGAARRPLRKGLELSQEGGATALAEQAQTELTATGARRRRVQLSGVESLTPSERRVADLAAAGLTTRRIAESLFVTPKTVEYHLRHTYQKLDISSRTQLTDALGAQASS
jgi:DNA-binding CsgD family transcriptional regulator